MDVEEPTVIEKEEDDEEDGRFKDLANQIALLMMDDDDDDRAEPEEACPVDYAPQQHRYDHRLPWICNNSLYYRHPMQKDLWNIPQIFPVEIIHLEGQRQYYRWANGNFTFPNTVIPSSVYNSKRERECIGTGVFIPRCRPDSRSKRSKLLNF
uniref:Uncharacterized protein n=1 Tax=Picea sitchensis TaxID=3332 RepID=A9P0Z7_PICSI|nr:unknown [Picea sitchensis]